MHWMHNCIYIVNRTKNYVGKTVSNIKMHSHRTKQQIESQFQILTQIKSLRHYQANITFLECYINACDCTLSENQKSCNAKYTHNISMSGNVCVSIVIVFQIQELVNIGCTEHKIPLMNQNTLKQTNFKSEPTLAWSGRLHTNISQGTLWE